MCFTFFPFIGLPCDIFIILPIPIILFFSLILKTSGDMNFTQSYSKSALGNAAWINVIILFPGCSFWNDMDKFYFYSISLITLALWISAHMLPHLLNKFNNNTNFIGFI